MIEMNKNHLRLPMNGFECQDKVLIFKLMMVACLYFILIDLSLKSSFKFAYTLCLQFKIEEDVIGISSFSTIMN